MLDLSSVIERAVADELAAWESGQVPEDARSPEERPGHWQRIDLSIMDEIGRPFTGIADLYRKLLGKLEHEPEVAPDLLPPESAVDRYMGGEWLPVISSNVAAIRYLPEENALEVEYHGGREHIAFYRYDSISEGEARDFAESPSKGKWVWNVLRLRGTVYGYQKPYVFLDAPSSYSPKWMESEETRAAHGAIGPDGRSALLSREWDETKIKRDEAGKFAEQNRARFHAIESGDLGHVQGFPVRRLGDKTWRIDTPGGYVEGGHEDVQAHIDQIKTHEASLKPMVDGALARADAAPDYNPFTDPGKAEAETKAFEALPNGAMVVSLDPMTRGRIGEIVKVSEPGPDGSHRRVTRVKLNGVLGFASNDIEPLDAAHSWRVDRPAKPAVPKMTQGVLFARRSYSGPGLFDGPHWTAYDGPHGGKGWKSTLTGQIRYQEAMPGEHEHEGPVQASEPAAPEPEPVMETPAGTVSAWGVPEPAAVAPVAESAPEQPVEQEPAAPVAAPSPAVPAIPSKTEAKRKLGVKNYEETVRENLKQMGSHAHEWTAVGVKRMAEGKGDKGQDMPEFAFPEGYSSAPSVFAGMENTCELCGHDIKNYYWIQNDEKKWTMAVGSECVRQFGEGVSGEQAAKRSVADANRDFVKQVVDTSSELSNKFSYIGKGNYGKTEQIWKMNEEGAREARDLYEQLKATRGNMTHALGWNYQTQAHDRPVYSDRQIHNWVEKNGDAARDLLKKTDSLLHPEQAAAVKAAERAESSAEPTPPVAELAKAKEPAKSDDKETAWSHSVTDYEKGRLIPAEMYDGLVPRGVEGFTLRVKKKPNGNYDVWTETRAGSKNPYATDKDADLARHAAWRAYNMGNPTQHASDFAVVINNHKEAVKAALAAGKPVPPEVLADYPDLAGPAKAAEAEPTPPAGEEPAPNAPPASPKKSLVEDFGEKIGGARKEVAKPLGARVKKADTGESERPAWARRYGISQIASSNNPAEVGKWSIRDAKDTDWHGQAKQKGKLFDTKEEAEQAVPLLAVARNHRVYAVSGAQVAGDQQFGIYRNITDRKRALIKDGFASENDAMKYMAANPEEIIEHKFPRYETYAYLDHVERKGPEHKTTDVAPADFQKTFQFRGGEFGNWQSGRDGVESLNHAYDALHDLTDAIGLPAKAAALNGDLAIAFGARGTGGENAARAHYEPGKRVMNLTKMMGAGSLAHEWAHALDHAIGKAGGDEANGISSSNYKVKLRPELESAAKNVRDTIASKIVVRAREELLEEKKSDSAKKALEEHFRDLETGLKGWSYRPAKPLTAEQQSQWDAAKGKILAGDVGKSEFISSSSGGRMSGRDSFGPLEELNSLYKKATGRSFHTADQNSKGKAVYWAIQRHVSANERVAGAKSGESDTGRVKSDFYNEAIKLDRTRAGDYYTEPHEMFARAFEAYVADKLHEKGIRSDYLVSRAKTDNKTYAALGMKPFPEGEERATINAAFDKFFAELKHQDRADDKGSHVQLFSTGFDESKHPRGQPENAGEFGPGGSATRDVLPPDAAKAKPENPGTPAKGKKLARPASRRGGSPVGPRDSESAMAAKKALAVGDVVSAKELGGGTNYTSLVKMADGTKGVFKPAVGEKEDLRSTINGGTYYRREVACSLVADVLGFNDLVPATVEKSVELGGVPQVGSVQHFADGANVAAEADEPYDGSEDLARGAVFDYLVGHMDRHYGNWMLQGGKMVLIDNGLSFPHSENKLESVYCAKGNMRLLKQCYEDDLELPDLSSWEGKWGKVEASLKQSGIEPDAIQLARGRFAALTAGSKKAKAEGKPFKIDDLPGLGVETVAHLFGANLMAMMKAEAEGAK